MARKYTGKKKPTVTTIKKVVKAVLKKDTEVKSVDGSNYATLIGNTSGYTLGLTNVGQGANASQRVGDEIKQRYLNIRYLVEANLANASPQNVAFAVVRYKTLPSAPVVWSSVYNADHPMAQVNREYIDLYTILKTHRVSLDPVSRVSSQGNLYIDLKDIQQQFYSGTSTDITKNGICIIAVSDQAANYPKLSINYRFGYTDS